MLLSLTDCFECLLEIFDRVGHVVNDSKALIGAFALFLGGWDGYHFINASGVNLGG